MPTLCPDWSTRPQVVDEGGDGFYYLMNESTNRSVGSCKFSAVDYVQLSLKFRLHQTFAPLHITMIVDVGTTPLTIEITEQSISSKQGHGRIKCQWLIKSCELCGCRSSGPLVL